MAVKSSHQTYSKKLIFNLLTVVLLGWLALLSWSMILWARLGADSTEVRLHQLTQQQRDALVPFHTFTPSKRFNTSWMQQPMNELSSKVDAIRHELPETDTELTQITRDALRIAQQFWLFVGMTAHVMLLKLTTLIAAIPLFLLAMTAGLIDGLNQRAIRTASLGRESSYVFHQLNRFFKRGLIVLLGLWTAVPVSITPALMLVPVSILLSVMVSVTASRFKKYL